MSCRDKCPGYPPKMNESINKTSRREWWLMGIWVHFLINGENIHFNSYRTDLWTLTWFCWRISHLVLKGCLLNKLVPRKITASYVRVCRATESCSAGQRCQCRPRLEKVFLSSSWAPHRVSKQTLPNPTRLNKATLAAGTMSSQSGQRRLPPSIQDINTSASQSVNIA